MRYKSFIKYLIAKVVILYVISGCHSNQPEQKSLLHNSPAQLNNGKMIQVSSHDTTGGNNDRINLKPGESEVIFNEQGPGVIKRIWVTIDSRDPYYLRKILLRIYWDNEDNPSVEVPIGDFFGCAYEYTHHTSQYIGMSSGGYYCYFPMPFNENARIEVVNESSEELYAFYYHINYYKQEDPWPLNTGYFHAQWNRDQRTTSDSNFVALTAEGKGQMVGMSFNSQSYSGGLFYMEGDEMIYVDGEAYPSIYGTGMEDYFTSGWYFKNGEYSAPYHGLVLLNDSLGRITAYRHHIPDAIPFDEQIKVTYEHGHNNEEVADISTIVFWYQNEPHKPIESIRKASLRIPLRRPIAEDAMTPEEITVTSGNSRMKDMSDYGVDWINNQQLLLYGNIDNGFEIQFKDLNEQAYNIDLYYTKGEVYDDFDIYHNNQLIQRINTGTGKVQPERSILLKNIKTNNRQINLRVKPVNSSDTSSIGLDAFRLQPVREFITDWYIIGPFPNPRDSDYQRFGFDSTYLPEQETKLQKTYTGKNGESIKWQHYTGGEAGYEMQLWKYIQPYEFVVSYALTYVYSPEKQEVTLMTGSDDALKVFLNKEEVYRFFDAARIGAPDQDRINLQLEKGWNELLLKIDNNFGGYAFYARFVNPDEHQLIVDANKEISNK